MGAASVVAVGVVAAALVAGVVAAVLELGAIDLVYSPEYSYSGP